MPSPTCEVKEGAGAYTSTTGGFNATPAAALTIKLVDSSARTWTISCVTTDELSDKTTVNAGLAVDPVTRTATLTAPVAGRTLRFKSIVNGGMNAKGKRQASYETTFCIYTLTGGGYRVLAADETVEGDATFGWVKRINELIRNPTGMPDATGGTKGALQLAGDLGGTGGTAAAPRVSGVTGTAGVAAIAATTMRTAKAVTSPSYEHEAQTTDTACTDLTLKSQAPWASATGANRNPGNTVVDVPAAAAGGTDGKFSVKIAGTERLNIQKDRVVFKGTRSQLVSILGEVQTSSTTPTVVASFPMTDDTHAQFDFICTFARRSAVTKAGTYKGSVGYRRTGGAAPTIVGAAEYGTEQETTAGDTVAFNVTSNTIEVLATAADADGRNWTCELRVQETTDA